MTKLQYSIKHQRTFNNTNPIRECIDRLNHVRVSFKGWVTQFGTGRVKIQKEDKDLYG
jgi:hypothetical protein